MKSILMLAYRFPPEGSAGTYRPLRLVRQLDRRGWATSVITLATEHRERYDPELLSRVPEKTEVIRVEKADPWARLQGWRAARRQATKPSNERGLGRTGARDESRARRWMRLSVRRGEAWLYHPDLAMFWIRPAVEAGLLACETRKPSVVWATGGPWSAFVAAARLSSATAVPYVLDFRDCWTLTNNDFRALRPSWASSRDRRTLYRLFQNAQAVIFRYLSEAECYWRAYPGALRQERVFIIPNGFEGNVESFPLPDGDRMVVLHAGTLSSYRYDSLLDGLVLLTRKNQHYRHQIVFLFVGEGADRVEADAARRGLVGMVSARPATANAALASLYRSAHVLLVLGRENGMRGHELLAGAKLFGYLKTGRPILGVLPEDETARILKQVGVTTIAPADDSGQIASVLETLLTTWSAGRLTSLAPDPALCEVFSSQNQIEHYLPALEDRAPVVPFVPGQASVPPSLKKKVEAMAFENSRDFLNGKPGMQRLLRTFGFAPDRR